MKNLTQFLFVWAIALFFGSYAANAQLLLVTEADAMAGVEAQNKVNVGARWDLPIRKAPFAAGNYISYIRFNLTPLTKAIDEVSLRLILNAATTTNQDIKVYVLNDGYAGGADEGGDPEQGETWTEGTLNWATAKVGEMNGDRAPALNENTGAIITSKATWVGDLAFVPSPKDAPIYFSSPALMDAINNDTDNRLTIIITGGASCNISVKSRQPLTGGVSNANGPTLEYFYPDTPRIPVTGVSLPDTIEVALTSKRQLKATIMPADANNKRVTWASSNTAVATVDQFGWVTAITVGTATITATTVEGGLMATSTVVSGLWPRDNEFDGPDDTPAGRELYSPKASLSGPHPRIKFAHYPLAVMKARLQTHGYLKMWNQVKANAKQYANLIPPPFDPTVEAIWGTRAKYMDWLALAYVLDDSVENKAVYMKGIETWINFWYGAGFSNHDLVTSQIIKGTSHVYDWLYNDLSDDIRNKVRLLIVNHTRWIRSPENLGDPSLKLGANQWRDREFGANHNWFNHEAQSAAAAALWGEVAQPNGADADEPELWFTTAVRNFYKVQAHLNVDGALTEGHQYSDFGLIPYLDFGSLMEDLATATDKMPPIIDCPAIRNLGKVRLHTLLPNKWGFKSWSDGGWKLFDDMWIYYFTASRFNDKESQTVATIMESKSTNFNWRAIFYYDQSLPALALETLPKTLDCTDLNLYAARNAWTGNQNFFAFKCGHAVGKSVNATHPNECTGHNQADPNSIDFWWNEYPIITTPGYQSKKKTSEYNLTRIMNASDGQEIFQNGAIGTDWFKSTGAQGYWARLDSAVTLEVKHEDGYHTYLGEAGGMYNMGGKKCGYRRRAVYFPSGAVVIADRINTPAAANLSFRLLTPLNDLALSENVFSFNVGGTNGTITDYSPSVDKREITSDVIASGISEVNLNRRTATVTKNNVTNAFFGTVINMADNKIAITKIDSTGITVKDNNNVVNFFAWDAFDDALAPNAPANLRATQTGFNSVELAWDAPTDNVGVAGYKVYKNGVFEKKIGGTAATVTGLTEKTEYTFTVSAIDNSNESVKSSALVVSTIPSPSDSTAPSVPENLTVANYTIRSADLVWNASTDNVSVIGYTIYVDDVFSLYVEGANKTTLDNLTPSTQYSITIRAKDYSGNLSDASNAVFFKTGSVSTNHNTWTHTPIPNQAGAFTVEYDVVPQNAAMNSLMAFSLGKSQEIQGLAVIARFSPTGFIDFRNATAYAKVNDIKYVANGKYHFRYSIDVTSKKYSVWVTPAGGIETLVADNYGFRVEQNTVASLAYFVSLTNGGDQAITNFTIGGARIKNNQLITFPMVEAKYFGDRDFALEASSSSNLPLTYESSNPNVATVTGSKVTIKGVGSTIITASQTGNEDYNAAVGVTKELEIAKADQTITFQALAAKKFGDAPFTLAATANSSLPLTYASGNTNVATISGNQVTIVGVGSATITASQAGNDNYNAAADAKQELVVGKADQTIVFQVLASRKYGDAPFTLAATTNSGLAISYVSSNPGVAIVSGNQVTIVGVGSATITASQAGNDNYDAAADAKQELVVGRGDQTITFQALALRKYGDAPFTLAATTNSGLAISYVSSNTGVATLSGSQVAIVGAGSAIITASQAGNENYNASADAKQELVVGKADQTITFQALAAKKFGDPTFTLAAITNSGLAISYVSSNTGVATLSGSQVTIVGAGIATITASQAGNENYNAAADVKQELVVGKADQTITFAALADKIVTDAAFRLSAAASSGLAIVYTASNNKVTVRGNELTLANAGRTTITASQQGNANYNPAVSVQQVFCIKPAKPTISVSTVNGTTLVLTSSAFEGNQWYLNDTAIAGETNITYTATQAGIYKVRAKVDNCTGEFSADQVVVITRIEERSSDIYLYPNPVKDWLTLKLGQGESTKQISVFETSGKQVTYIETAAEEVKIDVSDYRTGIYFIKVLNGSSVLVNRFVKQ